MRIAVLGCGSWGTALAILLARNGCQVELRGRSEEEISMLRSVRENLTYLPGFVLPVEVTPFMMEEPLAGIDLVVSALPSGAVRSVFTEYSCYLKTQRSIVLLASKGLEVGTGKRLSEVVKEIAPECMIGAISGPNLALEIVRGIPTAAIVSFAEEEVADRVRMIFNCSTFRVYRSTDVTGVELAGALKNVIAVAAGVSDGLGYGDNTKGALLARGLKEIIALGTALGANPETFLGIAGIGDLVATATSPLSRNYRLGKLVGQGKSTQDALKEIGQIAEGVPTSEVIARLLQATGVFAPILESVHHVLEGHLDPKRAVAMLMERQTPVESLTPLSH